MKKPAKRRDATVGVADLKARLSAHLRRVQEGHELVVTDHGRPVARIVPIPAGNGAADRRERLIRKGLLIPARRALNDSLLKRHRPVKAPGAGVLDELLRERDEAR